MEEYCEENIVEQLHIRQNWESDAQLKSFHCVFKFDADKIELISGLKTLSCQDFTTMKPPVIQ